MAFWTGGNIKKLQTKARNAQAAIRAMFENKVRNLGENRFGWGQYFDEPVGYAQHGIYGTSAGIQVLASTNPDLVRGASRTLIEAYDNADGYFRQKGDLANLYKLAYLAEAILPFSERIDERQPVMDEIITRALPSRGWGYYFVSDDNKDTNSHPVATASALLALQRYRSFRSSQTCEDSIKWLCREIQGGGEFAIYEIALTALALIEYKNPGSDCTEYQAAIDYCVNELTYWAMHRKELLYGMREEHSLRTYVEEYGHNKYLWFPTDCLTALVFLKLNPSAKTRRYVLNVVDYFVTQILEKHGFRPETNKRVSSVEHLWIYRLLQQFTSREIKSIVPIPYFQWTGAPWPIRILILLISLAMVSIALYNQFANSNPTAGAIDIIVYRIIWAVVGIIGSAVLGRAIWEFLLKGRGNDSR